MTPLCRAIWRISRSSLAVDVLVVVGPQLDFFHEPFFDLIDVHVVLLFENKELPREASLDSYCRRAWLFGDPDRGF